MGTEIGDLEWCMAVILHYFTELAALGPVT